MKPRRKRRHSLLFHWVRLRAAMARALGVVPSAALPRLFLLTLFRTPASGQLDPVSLILRGGERVANQLGVQDPLSFPEWIVRCIFLAPLPGALDPAQQCAAWLRRTAYQHLGVNASSSFADWFLRLWTPAPPPGEPDVIKLYCLWLWEIWAASLGVTHAYQARSWWRPILLRTRARAVPRVRAPNLMKNQLPRFVLHALAKLDRLKRRYLRHVDFGRLTPHLEQLATRFDHHPRQMRWLVVLALLGIGLIGTTALSLAGQILFFVVVVFCALRIRELPGRMAILFLIMLSMLCTVRYVWWRATTTLAVDGAIEFVLGMLLFCAEAYTWLIMLFGFAQTAWPLARKPVPLPIDPNVWPTVDVFIPTYNEPLHVVRPTIFAVQGMDWPADKIKIYLLDDGVRDEMRDFAASAGIGYITRVEHTHAKAGNINNALNQTQGEYVAIFDCDHMPTRAFLQMTMGFFLEDEKCAIVQTPHHFFSPDPFERNFNTFRRVPNEGNLFYGLIQDGNDLWNSTFFCGSCAVIKRQPLNEIGGIAVETVTEDAHTALKLHRRGWKTAYLPITLAAGLATESLSGHIGQRIRWARGMAQIFRSDNPWLGKGLSVMQRLCYSNAMLHFFYGIPRLIFLLMPLTFLFFSFHIINASAIMIAAYVLPHMTLANIANARMQGKFRHSFWAEVYESVLAWYIVLPTTVAFFNPKLGKFNVTAKGGLIQKSFFDWSISKPYLVLLFLNLAGFLVGIVRLTVWLNDEWPTVVLNLVWCTYNLIMLGCAIGVATEAKQVRVSHRVPMRIPSILYLPDGKTIACTTQDYSVGGLGLLLPHESAIKLGSIVHVALGRGEREFPFEGRVVMLRGKQLGVRFDQLSAEQERCLVQCTFGRADAWLDWSEEEKQDLPLRGMREILILGGLGYLRMLTQTLAWIRHWFPKEEEEEGVTAKRGRN